MTSLAGTKVEADEWGIDVAVCGSQKALALPPGIAVFSVSENAMAAAKKKKFRGLYLDLVDIEAFAPKKQTPTTPCIPLLYALDVQLDHILAEGLENRWARHDAMLKAVEEWAPTAGFRVLPRGRRALADGLVADSARRRQRRGAEQGDEGARSGRPAPATGS